MEAVVVALIGVAGNLIGVWLSHHLSKKDRRTKPDLVPKTTRTDSASVPGMPPVSPPSPSRASVAVKPKLSRVAVLSFASGLGGVLIFGLFAIVAVVAGHRAVRDIRNSEEALRGMGFARAGMVLGYLELALVLFAF